MIADLASRFPSRGSNAIDQQVARGKLWSLEAARLSPLRPTYHVTTRHVPCERTSYTRNASSQSSSMSLTCIAKDGEIVRSFLAVGSEHRTAVSVNASSTVRVRRAGSESGRCRAVRRRTDARTKHTNCKPKRSCTRGDRLRSVAAVRGTGRTSGARTARVPRPRRLDAACPYRALCSNAAPWLILPVVICLSQRLSHACLSTSQIKVKPRKAH